MIAGDVPAVVPPARAGAVAPRLSAMACLGRGVASLRANPELVLLGWVQALVVTALAVMAIVLPLLGLGFAAFFELLDDPESIPRALPELFAGIPGAIGKIVVAALVATLLLTVVLLVNSWFQAGLFGVLTAADRQAPMLRGGREEWRLFRTFSMRHLLHWANLYVWRFFGFYNLMFLLAMIPLLATLVWLAALGLAGERWGGGAAVGVGCGGFLPVFFLYLVVALWWMLGQADLAQDGSGVLAGSRRGLEVVGRRLGASLGLFLLYAAATLAVTFVFMPISFAAGVVFAGEPVLQNTLAVGLALVQWLALATITVAFSATLVSLMRSERRRGELA